MFDLADLFQALRPKLHRFETFQEACAACAAIEAEEAQAAARAAGGGGAGAAGGSSVGSGLMEVAEEDGESASDSGDDVRAALPVPLARLLRSLCPSLERTSIAGGGLMS